MIYVCHLKFKYSCQIKTKLTTTIASIKDALFCIFQNVFFIEQLSVSQSRRCHNMNNRNSILIILCHFQTRLMSDAIIFLYVSVGHQLICLVH